MILNQISSPPAANSEVIVNENLETLEHQAVYGKKHSTTSGLTWGYYGGRWGGFAITAGTLSLTASSTNYVVVAIATGVISVSTSSTNWDNDTDYVRVYKITTGASTYSAVEDHRAGPGGVHGGGGGGGGAGSVDLTTDVTGTLPVANGGTGRASHTAYAVVCGGTSSTAAQQSIASVGTAGHVLTSNGAGALPTFQAPTGGGDASTNTSSSVDSEVALFSGTGGKTLKRATGTGIPKLTSGVQSIATAGTDYYAPGSTDVAVADGGTGSSTASGARTNLAAAAASQTGEMMCGFIASPSNKDYRIVVNAAHGGTITDVTTRSTSGTCTATFKINTTALGGTANSVSSTETTQSHSSSNVFAAGDDIVITVSSNSSCADMSFTIKYTRTLA